GPLLLRGREVAGGIEPAHGEAEPVVGGGDRTPPAVALLLRTTQHWAEEGKRLSPETERQHGGAGLDGVEGEVVLPGVERLAGSEGGDPRDGAGLIHDEPRGLLQSGGGEVGLPVQARCLGAEVRASP